MQGLDRSTQTSPYHDTRCLEYLIHRSNPSIHAPKSQARSQHAPMAPRPRRRLPLLLARCSAAGLLLLLLALLVVGRADACPHNKAMTTTAAASTRVAPSAKCPLAFQSRPATPHRPRPECGRDTRLWWGLFGGGSKDKGSGSSSGNGGGATGAVKTKDCKFCAGSGAVPCAVCGGTGVDKKGGNVFERYKCMSCQGFGLVNCKNCNPRGLTPEQRGER